MRMVKLIVGVSMAAVWGAGAAWAQTTAPSEAPARTDVPAERGFAGDPGQAGRLDMTGKGDPAESYVILPVPRGQLKAAAMGELTDSVIKNQQGKKLGHLDKMIMDSKTGRVAYGVIELENDRLVPIPWSAFKVNRESGNVTLNMTLDQLQPYLSEDDVKDLSPGIKQLVKEMEDGRRPGQKGTGKGLGVTERPAAAGPMGENKTGGAGPSGPRGLPPGKK